MAADPQVRGEKLVAKVIEATLRELSAVGYGALSIEAVAERAGVNKTTIYRRWPTKAELVRDALFSMVDGVFTHPDEGSLRADLIAFARRIRDVAASPHGRGLFRVMAGESDNAELREVLDQIRATSLCVPEDIVARAWKRGELPKGFDAELLVSCIVAPVLNWVQMDNVVVDDRRIDQVVDLVLGGAMNASARRAKSTRRAPASPRRGGSRRPAR